MTKDLLQIERGGGLIKLPTVQEMDSGWLARKERATAIESRQENESELGIIMMIIHGIS